MKRMSEANERMSDDAARCVAVVVVVVAVRFGRNARGSGLVLCHSLLVRSSTNLSIDCSKQEQWDLSSCPSTTIGTVLSFVFVASSLRAGGPSKSPFFPWTLSFAIARRFRYTHLLFIALLLIHSSFHMSMQ
jgi:hypothetical protein